MRRALALLAVLGALCLVVAGPSVAAAEFKIVVNAANPVASFTPQALERMFLKKDTRWESGGAVEPVDQSVKAPARVAFSSLVHRKDVGAVKSYWQQQIFSGRGTPPPELSSDAEVVSFVKSHPGAVGYVSSGAALGDGVKVVRLAE